MGASSIANRSPRGFAPAWVIEQAEKRNAVALFITTKSDQVRCCLENYGMDNVMIAALSEGARQELERNRIAHINLPLYGLQPLHQYCHVVTAGVAQKLLSIDDRLLIASFDEQDERPSALHDCFARDLVFIPFDDYSQERIAGTSLDVLMAVVDLALEMGSDRTGKIGGTMFVVGSVDELVQECDSFLFEPFHLYPRQERNLTDPKIRSTVTKFARLDGAFLVSAEGTIERLVRKINPRAHSPHVDPGLGSRHATACSVTFSGDVIAITVSESAGNVTIFARGRAVTRLTPRGSAVM